MLQAALHSVEDLREVVKVHLQHANMLRQPHSMLKMRAHMRQPNDMSLLLSCILLLAKNAP